MPDNRLYVPCIGPTDWRRLLADSSRHWTAYKSAFEVAVSWEAARCTKRGLPREIEEAFDSVEALRGAELVLAFPEHRVSFRGGGHASQNDVWALLRRGEEFLSMTVEAKAGEPLDDVVSQWIAKKSSPRSRKADRLQDLQQWLGISTQDVSGVRYQLLHRAASALKEAKRFRASKAILLIQAFHRTADEESWRSCKRFGEILGIDICEGTFGAARVNTAVPLYVGWVNSTFATEDQLRAALESSDTARGIGARKQRT